MSEFTKWQEGDGLLPKAESETSSFKEMASVIDEAASAEPATGADERGRDAVEASVVDGELKACEQEWVYPPEDPGVHGDPCGDADYWHCQGDNSRGESGTCAVVAQEMVIFKYTGEDPGESHCLDVAFENGWFREGGGTAPDDIGKILGEHGIEYDRTYGNDLDALAEEIDKGHGVIVGVDADVLWSGSDAVQCNHALCVTGYERGQDGSITAVFVNDSGSASGAANRYDAATFREAFVSTGGLMVATAGRCPPDGVTTTSASV